MMQPRSSAKQILHERGSCQSHIRRTSMKEFSLYRKRIIPDECILLKNDHIVSFENNRLVTTWSALHPKKDLHHGISCYFLEHGIKVSKFYYEDGRLLYWYIDIITHSWNEDKSSLTVIDLLADVLIYPDGFVKVVDLDELADAEEAGIITKEQLLKSLRTLDKLLGMIYSGDFKRIRDYVESFE